MIQLENFQFPKNFSHITKLIATIKYNTKMTELEHFLSNGVRLFHINFATNTKEEICQMLLKLETSISNYHIKNSRYMLPIGKIFEIRGRVLRVGRMLHNCPIRLKSKQQIILTSDRSYEKCCLKEVTYISNFEPYIHRLKCGDLIFINGKTILLYVVKITGNYVTCCSLKKAKLRSYDEVLLPFYIPEFRELTKDEIDDIEYATNNKCDFILAPLVTRPEYFDALKSEINDKCIKLISCIDVYIQPDMNVITNIVEKFDGVWIKNSQPKQEMKNVIDCAKSFQKCSIINWRNSLAQIDFKNNQVDCIFFNDTIHLVNILKSIQKNHESKSCKYQLDKSRFPFRQNDPINIILKCSAISAGLLNAKTIVCFPKSTNFIRNLLHLDINCPIIAVLTCPHKAKHLNLFRNVCPVVYPTVITKNNATPEYWKSTIEKQMKFAIQFGRDVEWINIGDMVVFCFETGQGVEASVTIRLTYIADDKIVFCK